MRARLLLVAIVLSLAACAAERIHSSYQVYPTRLPSKATSFDRISSAHAAIVARAYREPQPSPIQLTASDGTGLAMKSLRVRTVIDGPIAFTELAMRFHNPRSRELEGRFDIVLPPNASVARLAMKLEGRWQDAEVVAEKRAQEVYESFLHKEVDPALLERGVGNRFRARVYPIAAKADKEIIISYTEELGADGAYRVLVAGLAAVEVLDVDVQHGERREQYVKRNYTSASDIVVSVQGASNVARASKGLVMMRWVPEEERVPEVPHRVSILVDSSASAAGVYGQQVRAIEALADALVETYGDGVELAVACFDHEVTDVFDGLATDYSERESEALYLHGALGATNVAVGLAWASQKTGRVLLIGDGIATIGHRSNSELVQYFKHARPERIDVLAFAAARNTEVLQALAEDAGRHAGIVLEPRDGAVAWARQMGAAASETVAIEVTGASWRWPETVRAVRPGEAVTVFAKFEGSMARGLKKVRIVERRAKKELTRELAVEAGHEALLQRQWATMQLAQLAKLQRARRSETRQGLIETLSRRFRILTPGMSFLMLETEADYQMFGISRLELGTTLTVDATGLRRLGAAPDDDWQTRGARSQPYSHTNTDDGVGGASIKASVRDKARGLAIAGVTAIATHLLTQGDFRAISDAAGELRFGDLPVGEYRLLLVYGDAKAGYDEIKVAAGEVAQVSVKLDLSNVGANIAAVRSRSLLDTVSHGRSESAVVASRPVSGRVFERAFSAADRAIINVESMGYSGTASLESQYVVDGLNTIGAGAPLRRSESRAVARFRIIRKALGDGMLSGPMRDALRWHAAEPSNLLALVVLGEALEAAGHYLLAERAYASIMDLYPSRADMHRVAAGYLARLGARAGTLRVDALRFAHKARPDHVHGTRLLAMAMASGGNERGAIALLLRTLEALAAGAVVAGEALSFAEYTPLELLIRRDVGVIAASWLARSREKRSEIQALLSESSIMVPMEPQVYAVLSWESDVARMALRAGSKFSGQQLGAEGAGYGPVAFIADDPEAIIDVSAVLETQAMMGFVFANVQVLRLSGAGHLSVTTRPFAGLQADESIALGTL